MSFVTRYKGWTITYGTITSPYGITGSPTYIANGLPFGSIQEAQRYIDMLVTPIPVVVQQQRQNPQLPGFPFSSSPPVAFGPFGMPLPKNIRAQTGTEGP